MRTRSGVTPHAPGSGLPPAPPPLALDAPAPPPPPPPLALDAPAPLLLALDAPVPPPLALDAPVPPLVAEPDSPTQAAGAATRARDR
ncbi:hypothetical protein WMF38_06225 [Sorangium sp. So ce118]